MLFVSIYIKLELDLELVVRICGAVTFELLEFVGTCVSLALQITHVHIPTGYLLRVWYRNIECGPSIVGRSTVKRWYARLYQFFQDVPPIVDAS